MTAALERELGYTTRSYDFELRSAGGNGRMLEGVVAVFNTRTRIPDRNGDFEEEILPGFADRSLREHGMPVMQFDHGKDPRVGTVPIGRYTEFTKERNGYHVRGELFDNAVVEPVRQAIAGGAIKGMSFRFKAKQDRWERRGQRGRDMDLRQVIDADVPEAGPVVFPAYAATSVTVRDLFPNDERRMEALLELAEWAGIPDLTGRLSTRSGSGGDPDAQPREGDAPTPEQVARTRSLSLLRNPIVLPRRNQP